MKKRTVFLLVSAVVVFFISCNSLYDNPMAGEKAMLTDGTSGGEPEDSYSSDGISSPVTVEGGSESGGGQYQSGSLEPGQLTAGEWGDLEHWEFWCTLFSGQTLWEEYRSRWGLNTGGRVVAAVDYEGNPVRDITVDIESADRTILYRAKTDVTGTAYLFMQPGIQTNDSLLVRIVAGDTVIAQQKIVYSEGDTVSFSLSASPQDGSDAMDLLFMVDATGSMCDELEYLKAEIANVVGRVASVGTNGSIRASVNFYRDRGDDYIVRSFPFTEDLRTVQEQIDKQYCDGGGDYPEAVHSALESAINDHRWSSAASARLLFLVLDAPPHRNGQIPSQIRSLVRTAAENGIRIIPVASSGVDKETEFILRSFGIMTGGTYLFLTDHSGIGNNHLEPTIGEYEVEYLNELLVKVIRRYGGVDDQS